MLTPKPHQVEAVRANLSAFKTQTKTKNIVACGVGKTLIALKTYDELKDIEPIHTIVVFVPTILLIQQFCQNFINEFGFDSHEIYIVCSRSNLMFDDLDADVVAEELKVPILKTKKHISTFLNHSSEKTKVFFCTYSSARLLENQHFDFGIFDEAHKTAGEVDKPFGFALHDENVHISKRLFLTATEKVELYKKEKRIGMNNTEIYGDTSYSMSFREAIRQGLITDYKLLVTVVSRSDIAHLISDRTTNLYEVANLYALEKAKKQFGIRKAITFHKTVERAKSFKELPAITGSSFDSFHVNGDQNSLVRKDIFNQFKKSKESYITNARCLTEGVDVPDADAIAFFDPKAGEVDIVQAIGRIVRLSEGKTCGYIIVPIYLWDLETAIANDAIARDSGFKNIIDVAAVLNTEDEDFRTKITNSHLNTKPDNDGESAPPFQVLGELPAHISKE